jgi:hypothetical protein
MSFYMMTHLHPPTSSSPLDLVLVGFNLFVFGSGCQLHDRVPQPDPALLTCCPPLSHHQTGTGHEEDEVERKVEKKGRTYRLQLGLRMTVRKYG